MTEPSGRNVIFPGPEMFAVMDFPVLRFVFVKVKLPVTRRVIDPSATLRTLKYSLSTGKVTPIWNPHKSPGTVKGCPALNCHLGPRPAKAGAAVTTPPNIPSSVPSATIAPSRLTTITSTGRDRPAGAGAAVRRSWIAGVSAAQPGGIRLESGLHPACDRMEPQQHRW